MKRKCSCVFSGFFFFILLGPVRPLCASRQSLSDVGVGDTAKLIPAPKASIVIAGAVSISCRLPAQRAISCPVHFTRPLERIRRLLRIASFPFLHIACTVRFAGTASPPSNPARYVSCYVLEDILRLQFEQFCLLIRHPVAEVDAERLTERSSETLVINELKSLWPVSTKELLRQSTMTRTASVSCA